jgi:hypothetical protein
MPADGMMAATKKQDFGTSGWQLAGEATPPASVGKAFHVTDLE